MPGGEHGICSWGRCWLCHVTRPSPAPCARPRPQPGAPPALPAPPPQPFQPALTALPPQVWQPLSWEMQDTEHDGGRPHCLSSLKRVALLVFWRGLIVFPRSLPWFCCLDTRGLFTNKIGAGGGNLYVTRGERDTASTTQMVEFNLFSGQGRRVNFYPSKK